ncbi:MAG: hypothetical protein KIS67_23100 [Verrucomicrobiae bacterium]|nr:hypothetical protein [Verrucomicrobiae bacterium]
MSTFEGHAYSTKTLAYCAGVVVLVYWLPFIYLAVADPLDEGRGGMVLCMTIPVVLVAVAISMNEMVKAVTHWRDSQRGVAALPLVLFAVTLSPLAIIALGVLRNVLSQDGH